MGGAPPQGALAAAVTTLRRRGRYGAIFACAGAAIVLVGPGTRAEAATAPPLRVQTSLTPSTSKFGDPVTARVEVDYAPGAVDPSTIHIIPDFIPYVASANPVVSRPRDGVVVVTYPLLCVTEGCLPVKGPRHVRFRPVVVSAQQNKSTVRATAAWRPIRVVSRMTPSILSGGVHFRTPAQPPPPDYRVAPGALSAALVAVALLCTVGAVGLAARWVRRRSHHRAEGSRLSRLELAVAYLRDSTRRSASDRRRALALLSEAVDEGEPELAATAAETAWRKTSPTPRHADALADRAAELAGHEP
jgi:hypothetical protein